MPPERVEVLIVGGGPAGLAAALELRRLGLREVVVVDREPEAGGIPRLCHHTGFGMFDLRRLYSGPDYARHYMRAAERAGLEVRPSTTITGWTGPRTLAYTSPQGLGQIEAGAVLLATGCRERPRSARLVPGDRPAGVFTTGSLQRFVYEQHLPVGRRALIVGAELVSLSALMTLGHAGVSVARMVTELPQHQIYLPFVAAKWWLMDIAARTPLTAGAQLSRICGRRRVEGVEITHLQSGRVERIDCDTVVFTGDWVPEQELARHGGLALDPGTRGPQIDAAFRASAPGVFCAGNLLRGAETADVSALEGRRAAGSIAGYLRGGAWPEPPSAIQVKEPIEWIVPNAVAAGDGRPAAFSFRVRQFRRRARVAVYQGDRRLHVQSFWEIQPNQSLRLTGRWTAAVSGPEPLRVELL